MAHFSLFKINVFSGGSFTCTSYITDWEGGWESQNKTSLKSHSLLRGCISSKEIKLVCDGRGLPSKICHRNVSQCKSVCVTVSADGTRHTGSILIRLIWWNSQSNLSPIILRAFPNLNNVPCKSMSNIFLCFPADVTCRCSVSCITPRPNCSSQCSALNQLSYIVHFCCYPVSTANTTAMQSLNFHWCRNLFTYFLFHESFRSVEALAKKEQKRRPEILMWRWLYMCI